MNATSSFYIAFMGLGVSCIGIILYIIGGGWHRMALVRLQYSTQSTVTSSRCRAEVRGKYSKQCYSKKARNVVMLT